MIQFQLPGSKAQCTIHAFRIHNVLPIVTHYNVPIVNKASNKYYLPQLKITLKITICLEESVKGFLHLLKGLERAFL